MVNEAPITDRAAYIVSPLVTVVDDDVSVLRAISRLLRACGFTVETFPSGEDFLDTLHRVPSRCLVLDLCLGGMNGFAVHAHLLASSMPPPPVILITAHDDVVTRERARRAGVVQYLRKPFEDAALIEAIYQATAVRPEVA